MFWYFDLIAFIDSILLPLLLWLFLLYIEKEREKFLMEQ